MGYRLWVMGYLIYDLRIVQHLFTYNLFQINNNNIHSHIHIRTHIHTHTHTQHIHSW